MNTKILTEVFSETDLTYIQQLDERQRRLYCATRAINIGKHGVAAVCASIHISKNTIYRGIRELNGISLGANLLSIFVPSYFLTVTKTKKSEKVSQ